MKRAAIILAAGLGLVALSLWLFRGGENPVAQAQEAYQRGDYATAVRAYQQAAPDCADLPALAANQAAALYRLDRYGDADGRYRLAESSSDSLRAARAAYDRGNCALRQACQASGAPDPALLDRAAEQFRACLALEPQNGDADQVFADARYNLELAKLVRNSTLDNGAESDTAKNQNGNDQDASQSADKSGPQDGSESAKKDTSPDGSESATKSGSTAEQSADSSAENTKPPATFANLLAQKDDNDYLCPD
jgi:hypothetical protein